jgi:L-ascorbate metabolism protein UlaG (beta-lactamase superfamily)
MAIHATEQENDTKLCHIANAGFFIESDGEGILIDTVIDQGLKGYVKPSKPLLAQIEKGEKPFDNIKLVLITHYHADHFDPASTLRHIRNNPETHYIMPPQAYDMIKKLGLNDKNMSRIHTPLPDMDGQHETYTVSKITTDIYRISHGANRPIENLGYKVTFNNQTSVFHPGDMSTNIEQLNSVGLRALSTDYLLLPFWAGLSDDSKHLVNTAWNAKNIIPMHFQTENREWMKQYGGPTGVQRAAMNNWDNTISLIGEMRCQALN